MSIPLNQLLYEAILGNSKKQQYESERLVIQMRTQHPEQFMMECVNIAADTSQNVKIRQAALTVMSRSINSKVARNYQGEVILWDHLTPQFRLQLKQKILDFLIDQSDILRKSAGNSVAVIAAIEVPRGEWFEIVHTLAGMTQAYDVKHRRTSVMILGFICYQLKYTNRQVSQEIRQQILVGILNGMKHLQDEQGALTCMEALRNAMPFLTGLTAEKTVSDYIMAEMLAACRGPYLEVRKMAVQALTEYAKSNYYRVQAYIGPLSECLAAMIQKANEETAVALNFWEYLGQMYLQMKDTGSPINYLLGVQEDLIKMVLSLLLIETDDSDLTEAALRTATTTATVCGNIVFGTVTNFVNNALQSSEWKLRQAGVLAFSTLCYSEDQATIEEMLKRALDIFMKTLMDSNQKVVENTLLGLSRIFYFFPGSFFNSPNYSIYIDLIVKCLNGKTEVAAQAINLLKAVMYSIKSFPNCYLSNNIFPLLNTLSNLLFSCSSLSLAYDYFSTINSLLMACRYPELACKYIEFLTKKLRELPDKLSELGRVFSAGILSLIYPSLLCLQNCTPSELLYRYVWRCVFYHFTQIKDIDPEGLYVVGALNLIFRSMFRTYFEVFWPYLTYSLEKQNETATVVAALGCLAEIVKCNSELFIPKWPAILEYLTKGVRSNINREIKPHIFMCIADCIAGVGRAHTLPHLSNILELIDLGFQAAITLSNNSEDFEYSYSLKEAALDLYRNLSSVINIDNKPTSILYQHFPILYQYILQTCDRKVKPTVKYLCDCLQTLCDTACHLKMTSHIATEETHALLDMLKQAKKDDLYVRYVVGYVYTMVFSKF